MNRSTIADVARRNPWEVLLLVILVGTIVFNVTQSDDYLGVHNLVNLFQLSIEKAIVVVVMTFVIIYGEIDLSVASVMGLAAAIARSPQRRRQRALRLAALLIAVAAGSLRRSRSGLVRRASSDCRRSSSRWRA